MSTQSYLLDTNIIIGLEDNHAVKPAYSAFSNLAAKHKVDVFVHEAARDDIARDKNSERRKISLSKLAKFQLLAKVKGLTKDDLETKFGRIRKINDEVDATLLHAIWIGAVDFLVTQDQGLHERARKHSTELAGRVLFVGDAAELLASRFEPKQVPIRHIADVSAHTIELKDSFFDSLRDGYPEFDEWWRNKCVGERRPCWAVYDNNSLAGLIVRKDERASDTDAITKAERILKICTFKVSPERRGVKLGELLLKQVLWFGQSNKYDLAYVTAYAEHDALLNLLGFYGFKLAGQKEDGELILERRFTHSVLENVHGQSAFDTARLNYPRFITGGDVRGFGIPIKEDYHDILYPDLRNPVQPDLLKDTNAGGGPNRPGNTIRKVYLCRAPSNLAEPGSLLFFYKGKSGEEPSQAMTAVGILEGLALAHSSRELMQLTSGRSVFSERQLEKYGASDSAPIKVINYLLVGYIDPAIELNELQSMGIFVGHPPQSIIEIKRAQLSILLGRCNFGFPV